MYTLFKAQAPGRCGSGFRNRNNLRRHACRFTRVKRRKHACSMPAQLALEHLLVALVMEERTWLQNAYTHKSSRILHLYHVLH